MPWVIRRYDQQDELDYEYTIKMLSQEDLEHILSMQLSKEASNPVGQYFLDYDADPSD